MPRLVMNISGFVLGETADGWRSRTTVRTMPFLDSAGFCCSKAPRGRTIFTPSEAF